MTASFPSEAWCTRAIELLNADPDAAHAAQGWGGDFGVVIDRAEGPIAIALGAPTGGGLPAPKFVTVAELEASKPRYFARASQKDWWALIDGSLDPIAAIVQKKLLAKGDLSQVISRLQYRGLVERWLSNIRNGG